LVCHFVDGAEPTLADKETVMASVDPEITFSESDGIRYLHFGIEWVQGAMSLARPNDPVIPYIRQMMGWLLFLRAGQSILQLGLGAGALAKFCHARLPEARITAVDLSPRVIQACRTSFRLPADDARLSVVCDDGERFVRQSAPKSYGVVQVDVYDALAQGPVLDSFEFYSACRTALTEPGIMVVNLFGTHDSFAKNEARIRRAFNDCVLRMPQLESGNVVLLGFRGPPFRMGWRALNARARLLSRKLGLEAPEWVAGLRDTNDSLLR